jgi:hypothetical protein
MASVVISGDTSGSVTLSAPTVAGASTQTLVAVTGTLAPLVSGTAVASTSGTSIDFTGIPAWVKRITVLYKGISTTGTSPIIVQLGTSAGFVITGYSGYSYIAPTVRLAMSTGFMIIPSLSAAADINGSTVINLITGNTWVETGVVTDNASNNLTSAQSCGNVVLPGTLNSVRITTNGAPAPTFDAGTINIMYE